MLISIDDPVEFIGLAAFDLLAEVERSMEFETSKLFLTLSVF